ncbi:BZ3500_MvSof-1268-A1-R1_Chr5-2g07749 [Microbotryum saponariae]|uniref:BZ3500_MvSof-1268-A1-R1_Chr5-2g07749 protein n=1 Tax=Microbotryum saponariae TaxID=289078 RepID=A0A2X0LKF2_9BASI|nr:BZ3500_MvSof-1268-A1-R1_Chr5-2g07749 [Microbotryum saponariae]SDA05618.1 BZ3501_MvSof-1269-A2-R1_Chr5-2g07571 [Microbotryum saponariae]
MEATVIRPHRPINSELYALERAKRVMYGRVIAPEDKDKKKQDPAGGANATDDQVSGHRVLRSAHPPLLISGVFRNGQTGFGRLKKQQRN